MEEEIHQLHNFSIDKFGKDLRSRLKSATKSDPDIQAIMEAIRTNWPSTLNSPEVLHYKKHHESLTVVDDTLLLGDKVVISKSLQPKILKSLHKGHPGIRRM